MRKVIILSAVTGSVHTPSMSPYLPITPDQIVEDIVKSWEAGAAIAHYHVRNPETGEPIASLELFREVATKVKKHCDIILCPTTGGAPGQPLEQRLAVIPELQPEMCTYNMGPWIMPMFTILEKYKEFEYPWERKYLEDSYSHCEDWTYEIFEAYGRTMAKYGTKPEIELYDVSHIDTVAWLLSAGIIEKPLYLQFVLGGGGMLPSVDNLIFFHKTARETLGDFEFAAASAGRNLMPIVAISLALGGNVRVGLEDALYIGHGVLAKSSAEQVQGAVKIIEGMGLEVATADETRQMLELKGLDKVNF